MLVGDVNDEHYLREKEKYERGLKAYDSGIAAGRFDLPLPEKPTPPKLNPAEVNALSGQIRTWLDCKTHELEEKVDEMLATNHQLLKILEERRNEGGGGGKPH